MARLYFLSNITSDLAGGTNFNRYLDYDITGGSTGISFAVNGGRTSTNYGYTRPLHPGRYGSFTGDYTVTSFVVTAATNLRLSIILRRINSAGTVQTSSAQTAEQSLGTTGLKSFTLTNVNLGTFAATDRLRVDYIVRNAGAHANQSTQLLSNDPQVFVRAPYYARAFKFG